MTIAPSGKDSRIAVSREEMIAWMIGSTPWTRSERELAFMLLAWIEARFPGKVVFYRSAVNDRQTRTVALRHGDSIQDAKKLLNINRNSLHGRIGATDGVPAAIVTRAEIGADGYWLVPFTDWRPHDRVGQRGSAVHSSEVVLACPSCHMQLTPAGACSLGC